MVSSVSRTLGLIETKAYITCIKGLYLTNTYFMAFGFSVIYCDYLYFVGHKKLS